MLLNGHAGAAYGIPYPVLARADLVALPLFGAKPPTLSASTAPTDPVLFNPCCKPSTTGRKSAVHARHEFNSHAFLWKDGVDDLLRYTLVLPVVPTFRNRRFTGLT